MEELTVIQTVSIRLFRLVNVLMMPSCNSFSGSYFCQTAEQEPLFLLLMKDVFNFSCAQEEQVE